MSSPTPKQMAAHSRRNIATAIKALRNIALRYDEVDQYFVSSADRLAEELDAFGREIVEYTAEQAAEAEDR
jgi:hypothetical protein